MANNSSKKKLYYHRDHRATEKERSTDRYVGVIFEMNFFLCDLCGKIIFINKIYMFGKEYKHELKHQKFITDP